MAYTTIDDPSAHFQTALWTGDGNSTQAITNDGNSDLQPDFVWLKRRNGVENHTLADTSRGVTKRISSNENNAEDTNGIASVQSDGFTVSSSYNGNASGSTYVGWQWKANGGTTSSDSNGDQTSTVQANTTAGFSIATFSASSSAGQTVGHGLGSAPDMYIWKSRARADNWYIYHRSTGAGGYLRLNTTDAFTSNSNVWSNTDPSSTIIYYGGNSLTNNNENHVLYSFKSIQGYSKFGSYTGNANADGPFIYTGFKPTWLLIRNTKAGEGWMLHDAKVDEEGGNGTAGNPRERRFQVNENQAEVGTTTAFDFVSNGFKLRTDTGSHNGSGDSIIYMAFAEHPFVSSKGVPATAR